MLFNKVSLPCLCLFQGYCTRVIEPEPSIAACLLLKLSTLIGTTWMSFHSAVSKRKIVTDHGWNYNILNMYFLF